MKRIALVALTSACMVLAAQDKPATGFKTVQLSDKFYCEGAHFADFNKDGKLDVVSGNTWWEGPGFQAKHEFYAVEPTDPHGYSKHFFTYTGDVNGDGWADIVVLGFPGEASWWFANPGSATADSHWKRHEIIAVTDNESPVYTDLTGDGKAEVVCSSGGYYGYATPDPADPTKPWAFHKISPKTDAQRFTHGLGVGDVNGDGKLDVIEKSGWWEQPTSLAGDPEWKRHAFTFTPHGGAQMYAYDVDGDGDNDVITSLAAHAYGLAWFEQVKENGQITFKQHLIMGSKPEENAQGLVFSQLHALSLADMDGDGLKDIVTGKRWWAHGPSGDPDSDKPAVLYIFKLTRNEGKVAYVPQLVHDNSGVGTEVTTGDLNGDGKMDIVVGSKKGTFVHIRQ